MDRRTFLYGCAGAAAASALPFAPVLAQSPDSDKEILVVVFLRGGCDGLHLLAPVSDKNYVDARAANLRIAESGNERGLTLSNTLNNLDFCLHPSAKALFELYQSKQLALIHAAGLSNGTRSHFDAQDLIERGINAKANLAEGWLARYLRLHATHTSDNLLPAVALRSLPLALQGSAQAVSMDSPRDYALKGDARLMGLVKSLYADNSSTLGKAAQRTIETIRELQKKTIPDLSPQYPSDWHARRFADSLQAIAQLVKMDVGLHVATCDFGGWDTHENQAWAFSQLTATLANSLQAFYNDLNKFHDRLTVVVFSEFGRRLRSNRSNGTDHGHGGVMMALGKNIKGGKMYGTWKGLATEQLDNGVDLDVTTDYRLVLGEILQRRLAVPTNTLSSIFPDFIMPKAIGFCVS